MSDHLPSRLHCWTVCIVGQEEEADGGGDSTARAAKWLAAALRGLKTSAAQYERKRRSAKTEILELRKEYLKYVAEHGARRAACARPLPLGCHRSLPPPLCRRAAGQRGRGDIEPRVRAQRGRCGFGRCD